MSVSVALCTYQGERYLQEQLDSLWGQTRLPDEVVVCDDGSTDATLHLLRGFESDAPFPVHIRVNPERLGSTQNFANAIGRCRGSVIMLCDQDDVWHRAKVERLAAPFSERCAPGLVFTDAHLIDETSHAIGPGQWEVLGFTPSLQRRFSREETVQVLCVGNVVSGATLALDARFRSLVLPIPNGWVHDAWLALLLAATGGVRMLPEPLVRYRVHEAQQIGLPAGLKRLRRVSRRAQLLRRMSTDRRDSLRDEARRYAAAVQRLREQADRFPPRPGALAYIEAKARHLKVRSDIDGHVSPRRRLAVVGGELLAGGYHRFSNGLSSAGKDLFALDSVLAPRAKG